MATLAELRTVLPAVRRLVPTLLTPERRRRGRGTWCGGGVDSEEGQTAAAGSNSPSRTFGSLSLRTPGALHTWLHCIVCRWLIEAEVEAWSVRSRQKRESRVGVET